MGQEGELNPAEEALLEDQRIFERLVAKATQLLKSKTWANGVVPHGITPKDLALDAITHVFLNPSTWDRKAYSNPYPVLAGIVRSKVANLVRSGRNQVVRELPPGKVDVGKRDDHDPHDASDLINRIEAEVAQDADMLRYVKAAQKSHKREDIAHELGMTVTQVTNLSKRVKRVFKHREEQFGIKINPDQENP